MEELMLLRIKTQASPFVQYIPGNFRDLIDQEETICVGAVFQEMACGAVLAEKKSEGEYALRYIFVDPKARNCGLGTYLLRGAIGEAKREGARQISVVYSLDMPENSQIWFRILEKTGFSEPTPVSTAFVTCLGDIPDADFLLPEGMCVYGMDDLPAVQKEQYETLLLARSIPKFADVCELKDPIPGLCSFCVTDGVLSGLLLVEWRNEELCVAGLYVRKKYRRGRTALALLTRTLREAKKEFSLRTQVTASAINMDSFSMCNKLLRRGEYIKETELLSTFEIRKDGDYEWI